ncbi:MAG: hypothetical protein ABSH49_29390 [Bryobacteraceae bacterium]
MPSLYDASLHNMVDVIRAFQCGDYYGTLATGGTANRQRRILWLGALLRNFGNLFTRNC